MWGDAMHAIQQFLPYDDFVAPSAEDIRGVLIPVPQTYGMSFDGASAVLRNAGFTPVSGGAIDSAVSAGTVVGTSPVAGSLWGSGSSVTIYVSDGTPKKPKKPKKPNGPGNGNGNGQRERQRERQRARQALAVSRADGVPPPPRRTRLPCPSPAA